MNFMKISAVALGLSLVVTPAMAQTVNANNLVNVNIEDVLNDLEILAGGINIDVSNNTVQVPIGIAANVCPTVSAAVLAQQLKQTGTAQCEATTATRALAQAAMRQSN